MLVQQTKTAKQLAVFFTLLTHNNKNMLFFSVFIITIMKNKLYITAGPNGAEITRLDNRGAHRAGVF